MRGTQDQKSFAALATKTKHSSALFAIRAGKAKDAREFYAKATLQAVERSMPSLPNLDAIAELV